MKSAAAKNTRTTNQFSKCTLPLDFPPILCHTISMKQTKPTGDSYAAITPEMIQQIMEDYKRRYLLKASTGGSFNITDRH